MEHTKAKPVCLYCHQPKSDAKPLTWTAIGYLHPACRIAYNEFYDANGFSPEWAVHE